jgi:hypothetical protein
MEGEVVEVNTHPMHAHATSKQAAVRPCDRSSLEPRGGRPGGMPTYAVPIHFRMVTETRRTPFPRTGAIEGSA